MSAILVSLHSSGYCITDYKSIFEQIGSLPSMMRPLFLRLQNLPTFSSLTNALSIKESSNIGVLRSFRCLKSYSLSSYCSLRCPNIYTIWDGSLFTWIELSPPNFAKGLNFYPISWPNVKALSDTFFSSFFLTIIDFKSLWLIDDSVMIPIWLSIWNPFKTYHGLKYLL